MYLELNEQQRDFLIEFFEAKLDEDLSQTSRMIISQIVDKLYADNNS